MKKQILKVGTIAVMLCSIITAQTVIGQETSTTIAQEELGNATFTVYGNCGMCEKTIERSMKNVKGVEKADWNKENKMIAVTFDPEVISLTEIKQKIADVGYDTDEIRATEKVYNTLPGCCQYDRPESKKEEHNHKH